MNNKLLKQITLPYNTVKGSYKLRQQKASNYTHKIINEVGSQLGKEGISLSKFRRKIKKFLPKHLSFFVNKNREKSAFAQLNIIQNKEMKPFTYEFSIEPLDNKKISIIHIPVIAHEITHLCDYLYHPKTITRTQHIENGAINMNKYYDFYDKNIYKKEKINGKNTKEEVLQRTAKQIKNFIKNLSVEDKINLLQDMRYNLISEKNAYKLQHKTTKKLHRKNIPIFKDFLKDETKNYMFDEKIELLKDMTYKIINRERRQNRIFNTFKRIKEDFDF